MAFEPQINELETKYCKKLEMIRTQTTITLSTKGEKISKVLSTRAMPCVNNIIVNTGSVVLDGNICASVLALDENNNVISLNGNSPFSATYNSSLIVANTPIFANTINLGIENVVDNDTSISFTQLIGIELNCVEKQNIKYVYSIAPANEKVGTIEYATVVNAVNESFELNTELDLPSSISKILLVESFGVLKDNTINTDIVTLNGEVITNLVYLTNDENPKLKNQIYTNDFHQEILVTGANNTQSAIAMLNTCCNEYELQGELSSAKGVVVVKNRFSVNIFTKEVKTFDSVIDAFCPKKELKFDFQSFLNQKVVCNKVVLDKVDGNIALDENEVRIDKVVLSSSGYAVVNNTQIIDNDIIVQGTLYNEVVYLLDDDDHTTKSIKIETPFESSIRCDKISKADIVHVNVLVKETDARNKKSKEIDVLSEIIISVIVMRNENEAIMNNVTIGENRITKNANMGIYVVEQVDNLWDIAKELLINPNVLMEQNPNLVFPITKPTQIIIYRQQ